MGWMDCMPHYCQPVSKQNQIGKGSKDSILHIRIGWDRIGRIGEDKTGYDRAGPDKLLLIKIG